MAHLHLNGEQVEAEAGRTLLEVALEHGVFIPHLCFHPGLSAPAHCRMCLTEVELNGERQLTTACNTPVEEGMVVDSASPTVAQARESVLEFMLLNHPLDCPVCDKSGECELQEYSFANGRGSGRYAETRRTSAVQEIGERLILDGDRCIQCTRCVRFSNEISGTGELGSVQKGGETSIELYPGQQISHRLSGNLVDLCPVGAILEKGGDSQPIWQLTGVDSICPGCSTGCSIRLDVGKDERIRRIVPRVNMQVNEHWMCDEGRYGWGYVHGDSRLMRPQLRGDQTLQPASWDEALALIEERIGACEADEIVAVFSSFMTNEEVYLFAQLAFDHWGVRHACLPEVEEDGGDVSFPGGLTIREDRSPNSRGVAEVLSLFDVELQEEEEIRAAAEQGQFKVAYVISGDPLSRSSATMAAAFSGVDFLVVQDIRESELSRAADALLPGCTFAEKDGTYMNCDGRVQRIRPAIAPSGEARPDWSILSQQLAGKGASGREIEDASGVFSDLGARARGGSFDGLSYERLDAREPTSCSRGRAFGGGWASLLQRLGFLPVEDHRKVNESWKPTS